VDYLRRVLAVSLHSLWGSACNWLDFLIDCGFFRKKKSKLMSPSGCGCNQPMLMVAQRVNAHDQAALVKSS
jgi:hypothetical protein